jgi:hypothetical protein
MVQKKADGDDVGRRTPFAKKYGSGLATAQKKQGEVIQR